jgi:spore germination protein YaaH
VPYDAVSWQSLVAQVDNLDYVALQVATLDYCGNVSARDDRTLIAFAKERGVPVLASLFTSSEPLNHSVLTNATASENAVRQLAEYVVAAGYDGLDIDMEAVPAGDRAALTAFVAKVSSTLRAEGKLVTMAMPAKAREATTGWAGAYDYAALGPHLDLAIIMAYAYTTSSGSPGSTAPLDWVTRVTAYTTSQIPAEKVLMGVGLWAYDWNTTAGGRAKSLRYPQAQALAAAYGKSIAIDPTTRSATFSYSAQAGAALPYPDTMVPVSNHEMVERKAPFCPLTPVTPTPVPRTPVPTATPSGPQQHVVWLENAQSVAERLEVFERYDLAGAAGWRLGHEDPTVWGAVADYRLGR